MTIKRVLCTSGVGRFLAFGQRPSEATKRLKTIYDVQGRLDLNVYVLSGLHHVHVVLSPHAFSCASRAVSMVELRCGRAKLGVNVERLLFSVVEHGLHHWFAGGQRGRKTYVHVSAKHGCMCASRLVAA